jgi:hypothetical protein
MVVSTDAFIFRRNSRGDAESQEQQQAEESLYRG